MADTNASASASATAASQPRKLPFKRTVKRKPVEEVSSAQPPASKESEDDSLELFKQSRKFFPSVIEDQKKEAAERAAKAERERQEAAAAEEQRKRDDVESWASRTRPRSRDGEDSGSSPKRRRTGSWNSDEEATLPPVTDLKSSPESRKSSGRDSALLSSPATKPSSARTSRPAKGQKHAPVISLDDSDDDPDGDYQPPWSKAGREPPQKASTTREPRDESPEVEVIEEGSPAPSEDDVSNEFDIYVQRARERVQKAKEAQLLGSAGTPGAGTPQTKKPVVEVLVAARDDALVPTSFKMRTDQRLGLMFEAYVARQAGKQPGQPDPVLDDMVFTWKRNKLWNHTTLSTLGINPDPQGSLYSKWESTVEGYDRADGQDKVFFEAWTREQFEEYEQAKEYHRLRALGELDDDSLNTSFPSVTLGASQSFNNSTQRSAPDNRHEEEEDERKVRIIFKPKQLASKTLTVKPSTTVSLLVKVFCKLSELPMDTKIELHWDGEILDPQTTVEEADIDDMDSVEVHLK